MLTGPKEFAKQRIQIISFFILGMAFIFDYMLKIVTQGPNASLMIVSGAVMQDPLFLFLLGLISMFFYSRFFTDENKKNLELGSLFFWLFSVTVVFSLLDMYRIADFFTIPKPELFYISDFIFNLGFYNILMVSFIVYFFVRFKSIKNLGREITSEENIVNKREIVKKEKRNKKKKLTTIFFQSLKESFKSLNISQGDWFKNLLFAYFGAVIALYMENSYASVKSLNILGFLIFMLIMYLVFIGLYTVAFGILNFSRRVKTK